MSTDDGSLDERVAAVRRAGTELFTREFDWSAGHLATLVGGCAFAPSLLTFWFVNGILDFSTAVVIGTVQSPGGLVVRLLAYLLLVPTFLLVRMGYYLLHPHHRRTVLSGACPSGGVLSLDWFSVGILATGLPLALETLGPWVGANVVFLLGLFVLPRFVTSDRLAAAVKVAAIGVGSGVFLYASYGDSLAAATPVPTPADTVGPVATLTLTPETTRFLLSVTNSLAVGPVVVAGLALAMNRVLTRPELTTLPLVRLSLPRRDPARVVLVSAALGTVFYLLVVLAYTGHVTILP